MLLGCGIYRGVGYMGAGYMGAWGTWGFGVHGGVGYMGVWGTWGRGVHGGVGYMETSLSNCIYNCKNTNLATLKAKIRNLFLPHNETI